MTALTCATLLTNHPQAWESATVHPFLQSCQRGTITPDQFNTWLIQDYLFVTEFTRLAAQLLAAAPVSHFDTLLSGLVAIKDELLWFQAKAKERSLSLSTAPQPTCQTYQAFMRWLSHSDGVSQFTAPYAVQATAFWAIELAYNQGWQRHSPMPEPYTEFADRWGNPGFTDYVKLLEQQADSALSTATPIEQQQAEQAFVRVAQLEKDFWQMAFSAS